MKYMVLDTMRFENYQRFEEALNRGAEIGYRVILTVGTWVVLARKDAPITAREE